MNKYFDNLIHFTVLGFGLAFFIKGFIPLSKIAISASPLPTTVKAAYNA